ncbi:MAG: hypothetical protein MJ061_03565 [Mailhella sp.]|nr:hypothetical protein [Mailhella sp.]
MSFAGCVDGIGGEHFARLLFSGSPEEIRDRLASIPPEKTIPEQWSMQVFLRTLLSHPVIFCGSALEPETVRRAHCISAATAREALDIAFSMKGPDAEVVVIPDGVSTMITRNGGSGA